MWLRFPLHLLARGAVVAVLAGATPAFAQDVTVTISNFAFTPKTITIAAGGSVTFVNADDTVHSVIADDASFRSDGLDTGDKATFHFAKSGSIAYHCGLHPFMTGEIVIK